MNLRQVSDKMLIEQTDSIAQQERDCLTSLLHHLKEIESRRLFSALGYPSLFEYAVKRLRYSEDQAARRISAMRLLKEIPQVEDKINSGELSLTNLNMAQSLFRREAKADRQYSKRQKLDLLKKLENKSSRDAERELAVISPQPVQPDRIRPVSEDKLELKTSIARETLEKLERLKGLLAHSHPDISMGQLIDELCDVGLRAWDKSLPAAPRVKVRQKVKPATDSGDGVKAKPAADSKLQADSKPAVKPMPTSTPTASQAAIYREVWRRDKTCRRCGSSYALQIDHIVPRALGGASQLENLRLLCRKCNQRSAIEVFGREKMGKYMKSPRLSYLA